MEALEDMRMEQADPFADADDVSLTYNDDEIAVRTYEGESYASSETSTLLDGTDFGHTHHPNKSFLDVRSTMGEGAALDGEEALPMRTRAIPVPEA